MSRLVFYNAGPPSKTRPGSAAAADLGGLLREYRPRVAGVCEVIGDQLQPVSGYQLVRDTSRRSRANVAAYVREDCELRRTWWIDHRTRWARTDHPGIHEPRSTMLLGVGQVQVLVGHQVPLGTDHSRDGQLEIVHALQLVMAPWKRPRIRDHAPELSLEDMKARPRVLLWDDNAPGDQGLGSDYLSPRIPAWRHGEHLDNALQRNLPVGGVEYVQHAGGVQLGTDHPWGALVVHVDRGGVSWA